jgi:protoporphyrinogen oxidase
MKATIVGAGIGGLVAVWRLLDVRPDAEITLIDRDTRVGGLLAGGLYGDDQMYFDTGTHIPRETGIERLDAFLQSSVSAESLIIFDPPKGDLAGSVFAGRFQSNSHFPDLRPGDYSRFAQSIRQQAASTNAVAPLERTAPLAEQLRKRFGAAYADELLLPRLSRIFGVPADELCAFALELPGVTRVIIDDLDTWAEQAGVSETYRGIVGVPEQRQLPAEFRHVRRSYYSRKNGSSAFMTGAANQLRALGVDIRLGAKIRKIDTAARIVNFTDANGETDASYDILILSAGIMPAAAMLGHDLRVFSFDRTLQHRVLHMLLPEPPKTDCCYGYSLESESWYRFTNYSAFSGDPSDRRFTVETLGNSGEDLVSLAAVIRSDLFEQRVLTSDEGSLIGQVVLPSGFPKPSVRNFASLGAVRQAVTANLPSNVMLAGVATGNDVFFQNEVVTAIYHRLPAFVEANA